MLRILVSLKNVTPDVVASLEGHDIEYLNGEPLLEKVAQGNYHAVLTDDTADLLEEIKAADPRAEVVIISDGGKDSVELVKRGAYASLSSPLDSDRLSVIVDEIGEMFEMRTDMSRLEEELDRKYTFSGIVGRNPKILEIISFIRRIAPYFKSVTVLGETGTGKEVIARALHTLSAKPGDPFITSNCGGYVETLIESELFGHKQGAFTGAVKDKVGLFEAAKEGVLFLDEIGDLPLSFQPHLLRVLQNGEFRPVGSHQVLKSRCRIIAATSKNLKEEVKAGRFREDLFYRVTPLVVEVPALRDRRDDIALLSRFMIKRYNEQTGKSIQGISRSAQDILLSHHWPGNVRELENVINQAVILASESFIKPTHFPPYLGGSKMRKAMESDESNLGFVVKRHIEAVLEEHHGNRSRASRKLGISRRALLRKIEKYNIK